MLSIDQVFYQAKNLIREFITHRRDLTELSQDVFRRLFTFDLAVSHTYDA
jgi:hypothetical protein